MYKKAIKPKEEIVGYICDICNEDCNNECATMDVTWGYFSTKDGTQMECHMCEKCFDKVTAFIENDLKGIVRTTEYI